MLLFIRQQGRAGRYDLSAVSEMDEQQLARQ